jgi:HK97 family phage prohead protease
MEETEKAPRPTTGEVETRRFEVATEGRKIRGVVPYGIESRDMGGWREVIDPGALRQTNLDELVARVDHAGVPIGRYPKTLDLEERNDGLHWSVIPPESRADLREAIERGDLRAGSWQMVVAKDRWEADVRHVEAIAELRDVSIVSSPAYPAAAIEYRAAATASITTAADAPQENIHMSNGATEERTETPAPEDKTEERSVAELPEGRLQVTDRTEQATFHSLADAFRARGFPGETATLDWGEYRTLSWGGTVDGLSPERYQGVALGADQRYAFPAFPAVRLGADVTSVQILRQDSRTLAAGSLVVRAVDATSTKPEVTTAGSLVTYTMKQVAAKESGIPNLYLQQSGFDSLVETDLRLSINEGLDKLVNDGLSTSGTLSAGTLDVLTNIRKSITAVTAGGYNPDTLLIDPAGAEAIDLFRSSGSERFFAFGAGRFAPGQLFGLGVRVSKTAGTAVVDSRAFGKLYVSPISLARFEENAGASNTSTVRLEGNAVFGTERTSAAVRIMP